MKKTASLEKAKLIAEAASEKKGENIVLMDMRGVPSIFDWFVMVSASSSRRIKAISDAVQEKLSADKAFPLHIEGRPESNWILLDYEDVIVHIFYSELRDFYGLERLWADVPIKQYKCLRKTSRKK